MTPLMSARLTTKQSGLRGQRIVAAAVLFLGLTGAVTASPALASSHARAGGASASRLWHPSAFGHGSWVTPATALTGSPVRGAGGGWQTEPTPNPGGLANGTVAGISCGGPRAR